jgi:predicted GNAT family N-acyltransferase
MFGAMESAPLAALPAPPIELRWQWLRMSDLTATEMYAALAAFYASLGFRTVSAPYEEDGILHLDMPLRAT